MIKMKIITKLLIAISFLVIMIANSRTDRIEHNALFAILVFLILCSI